jgi:hypothetical protein
MLLRNVTMVGGLVVLACAAATFLSGAAWAGSPSVTMSSSGTLHDQQTITVSVGPNTLFTPHSRVIILECADPAGTVANLPRDDSTCDGNTVQGDTVLVAANGSFSESAYTIFQLPSSALDESSNDTPVCSQAHVCVLYVGQNQNDFTAPKLFSEPFTVTASSATSASPATMTTTTTVASAASAASAASTSATANASSGSGASAVASDPTVSLSPTGGTLPNTGLPGRLPLEVMMGTALLVVGSIGRRLASRKAVP